MLHPFYLSHPNMVYISANGGVHAVRPPPTCLDHAKGLVRSLTPPLAHTLVFFKNPCVLSSLLLLLLCSLFAWYTSPSISSLLVPTQAHSLQLGPSHDALIASDPAFVYTYSRHKPTTRASTWTAWVSTWWGRLEAWKSRRLLASVEDALGAEELEALESQHSSDAHEWSVFGEELGDEWDIRKGGFTRCAQAAFAIETYFCGSGTSTAIHSPSMGHLFFSHGVDALEGLVARALQRNASLIVDVSVRDDKDKYFGHVFSIRVAPALPSGGVKLYMSFIGEYTLKTYLQRHPLPLSTQGWGEFLQGLRVLEAASGNNWTEAARKSYLSLFGVDLEKKTSAGNISLAHAPVCIVPPWNGTAADPFAPGHEDNEKALLIPTLLQTLLGRAQGSMWGEDEEEWEEREEGAQQGWDGDVSEESL